MKICKQPMLHSNKNRHRIYHMIYSGCYVNIYIYIFIYIYIYLHSAHWYILSCEGRLFENFELLNTNASMSVIISVTVEMM